MRAGKASTPADELLATGLVPEGEGGNVVRLPGSRITSLPISLIVCTTPSTSQWPGTVTVS